MRLWIGDRLVIDNWADHSETEDKGSIKLEAGRKYRARLEYFYAGGWGVTRLFWSSASQPREALPAVNGFQAEYFSGVDLRQSVMARSDAKIDFTWGNGLSPFSKPQLGRAAPMIELPAGKYRAEWVDTKTGAIAKREAFDHKGGPHKLVAPDYRDDVALRIQADGVK